MPISKTPLLPQRSLRRHHLRPQKSATIEPYHTPVSWLSSDGADTRLCPGFDRVLSRRSSIYSPGFCYTHVLFYTWRQNSFFIPGGIKNISTILTSTGLLLLILPILLTLDLMIIVLEVRRDKTDRTDWSYPSEPPRSRGSSLYLKRFNYRRFV